MERAGLSEQQWRQHLAGNCKPLRLFALRVFATAESGAGVLLTCPPRKGEAYPWLWALVSCASLAELQGKLPDCLLERARFLIRRNTHRQSWVVRRSREECLRDFADAFHPQQILACAVRLLELHGEKAIPVFLDFLRHPPPSVRSAEDWEEKAECAAWALGQLGRAAIPEMIQAYNDATQRVRRHLAVAFWYSGPGSVRALAVLLEDCSQESHAALLAMEQLSSQEMVKRRLLPFYLDPSSIQEIAMLAFSDEVEGRLYAAMALGAGSGTALKNYHPILRTLLADPDPGVRRTAASALSRAANHDAWPHLMTALIDIDEQVRLAASEGLRELMRQQPVQARQALLDWVKATPPEQIKDKLEALFKLDTVLLLQGECGALLDSEPLGVYLLGAFLQQPETARPYTRWVQEHLKSTHLPTVRQAAARLLVKLGGYGDDLRTYLWEVLEEGTLAELAARGLLKLGEGTSLQKILGKLSEKHAIALLNWLGHQKELGQSLCVELFSALTEARGKMRRALIASLENLRPGSPQIQEMLEAGAAADDPLLRTACGEILLNSAPAATSSLWGRDLPDGTLALFVNGKKFTEKNLVEVEQHFTERERASLFVIAWPNLSADQRELLVLPLGRLGAAGLGRLEEVLNDSKFCTQTIEIFASLWTEPSREQLDWLELRLKKDWNLKPLVANAMQTLLLRFSTLFPCSLAVRNWLTPLMESTRPQVAESALLATGQAWATSGSSFYCELLLAACRQPSLRKLALLQLQRRFPADQRERRELARLLSDLAWRSKQLKLLVKRLQEERY